MFYKASIIDDSEIIKKIHKSTGGGSSAKPGDHVLIWGASGGLGSYAVQLCQAISPTPDIAAHGISVGNHDWVKNYIFICNKFTLFGKCFSVPFFLPVI